jgi:hypothetical protein
MTPWRRDAQAVQARSRKPSGALRRSCCLIQATITNPSSAGATMPRHAIRFWPPLSDRAKCGCGTARPISPRPGVVRSEQRWGGLARLLPRDHGPLVDRSRGIQGADRGTGPDVGEGLCTDPRPQQRRSAKNVDLPVAVSPHGLWRRVRGCAFAAWARMMGSTGIAELRAAYAAWSFRVSMSHILPRHRGQRERRFHATHARRRRALGLRWRGCGFIPQSSRTWPLTRQNAPRSIPRISRERLQTAAQGGLRLHVPGKQKRPRRASELGFLLVAGPGFEPG